jgi:acyl-CoA thioester hydrolase
MWRAAVGPWNELVAWGFDAVVAETNVSFRAPARFDDELRLELAVTRLGTTAVTTSIDVLRGDELLVSGWLRHVCVSTDTWAKTELPARVRDGLRRFATETAEREPDAAERAADATAREPDAAV